MDAEDVRRPLYHDFNQRFDNVDMKRVESLEKQIDESKSLPMDMQKRLANDNIQTLLQLNKELKNTPPQAPPPSPTKEAVKPIKRPKTLPSRKRKRFDSEVSGQPNEVSIIFLSLGLGFRVRV